MKLTKARARFILRQSRKWVGTKEIAHDMKVSQGEFNRSLKDYKDNWARAGLWRENRAPIKILLPASLGAPLGRLEILFRPASAAYRMAIKSEYDRFWAGSTPARID